MVFTLCRPFIVCTVWELFSVGLLDEVSDILKSLGKSGKFLSLVSNPVVPPTEKNLARLIVCFRADE